MFDEILNQTISKCVEYCSKDENIEVLEKKFLVPVINHISRRFVWLSYSFQTMAIILILQTILIVYLIFLVRSMGPSSGG